MRETVILFVCSGNTCRSPLAAAMARGRLPGVRTGSAGTGAVAGQPASDGSRIVAADRGLDLSGHLSRPLTEATLAGADWVIVMTRDHLAAVQRRFPDLAARLGLLGVPGRDLRGADPARDPAVLAAEEVVDPIGGGREAYLRMAAQVERLLDAWAERLGAGAAREGEP